MKDIQCVYIRDIAKLTAVDFSEVILITAAPTAQDYSLVVGVLVDGSTARFIKKDATTLCVIMPEGITAEKATMISLQRVQSPGETEFSLVEEVPVSPNLARAMGTNNNRITLDAGVLRISGVGFLAAVQVLINKKMRPFVILDERTVISVLSDNDSSIDSIDVILTSRTMAGSSFFSYMLTPSLSDVGGQYKLMQQVVKVLLTTPGSDVFDRGTGAGLQRMAGANIDPRNTQGFVAKLVSAVMTAGMRMQAAQMFSSLPAGERLGLLEIVNVGFDPADAASVDLTLKLTTIDGRQAMFGMLVNTVAETVSSFAAGV